MKLSELLNVDLLDRHRLNGYVGRQFHPTLPLRILNYTHLAQYDGKAWGDGTIDYCRGLIVDNEDNIIARPFKKFHNLNTESMPETMAEHLPFALPEITIKMDGSLGIWYPDGTPEGAIATRGSFTSPQALWATKWWKLEANAGHRQSGLYGPWKGHWTPLFEIIYPENRIVVDYKGFAGLICIGGVYIDSGLDVSRSDISHVLGDLLVGKVYISDTTVLGVLAEQNRENEEGYVASFEQGKMRVKIKFAEYMRLHRIITGMNARILWELFRAGDGLVVENLPEHVRRWYGQWHARLSTQYASIYDAVRILAANHPEWVGSETERQNRARRAAWFFQQNQPELKSAYFAKIDGKDVAPIIWDMIEPRGDDRSFQPLDMEEV